MRPIRAPTFIGPATNDKIVVRVEVDRGLELARCHYVRRIKIVPAEAVVAHAGLRSGVRASSIADFVLSTILPTRLIG
jgi:hypothetical protein